MLSQIPMDPSPPSLVTNQHARFGPETESCRKNNENMKGRIGKQQWHFSFPMSLSPPLSLWDAARGIEKDGTIIRSGSCSQSMLAEESSNTTVLMVPLQNTSATIVDVSKMFHQCITVEVTKQMPLCMKSHFLPSRQGQRLCTNKYV